MEKLSRIGLSLSGGGTRAMAFHCGVLKRISENNRLEHISHISSVSGGSLLIGLIFGITKSHWPSSDQYLSCVRDEIRRILTETDIQRSLMLGLLKPYNWKYLLSRANVLSQVFENDWAVTQYLKELPNTPMWTVNGTTAETGRRFRFKNKSCGDYELGYTKATSFKVAQIMAASAAFPGGIGPFVITTKDFTWHKKPHWDSEESEEVKNFPYTHLHLYDGGIYDNLGIEPLFDVGINALKSGADYLIVSDAGMPLKRISHKFPLNPFRIKRILDIALDQTRALRIRTFVKFLINNDEKGEYIQIGVDAREKIEKYRNTNEVVAEDLLSCNWMDSSEINKAISYPTNLKLMEAEVFDRLERHGYETALWNDLLFSKTA